MRTLAIRYWLVVTLAIFFVSAVSPFVYVGAVVCATAKPPEGAVALANMLSADVSHWTDPTWQKELSAKLPPDLSVSLLSPGADQELFHVGKMPRDPTDVGYTRVMVMDGKRQVGIANLYNVSPCGGEIYGSLA